MIAIKWLDRGSDRFFRDLNRGIRNAEKGARAEDRVAAVLATLPAEYHVIHNLGKLSGDIDHIVVGPTGVFVIETKSHGGKITAAGDTVLVNGQHPEKDFIAQSWRNAFWVRDVLKNVGEIETRITPILVFTNGYVSLSRPVKGVRVVYLKKLLTTICSAPPETLPLERIVEILERKMG